jgi:hypothetical protein
VIDSEGTSPVNPGPSAQSDAAPYSVKNAMEQSSHVSLPGIRVLLRERTQSVSG